MKRAPNILLLLLTLMTAGAVARQNNPDGSISARCVIGLDGIKPNAEGGLTAIKGMLEFHTAKSAASVPDNSIESIFVGSEFTQNGGKELEGNASTVPNDDGAALSPFVHSRVDMLTIAYRDSNGGLHAAVLALPKDYGNRVRAALLAQGAHAGGLDKNVFTAAAASSPSVSQRKKYSAAGIVVEPVSAGTTKIPAEYRMAIYENLVEQIRKSGVFRDVVRSGDRAAGEIPGLLTLRTTVQEFKEGSERERELTYYAFGRTKITVNVQVLNRDGNVLIEHKVSGRVLAIVENLSASHFVAEHVRRLLSKNF